ncbi:hypothetical protein ABPG72_008856 [Tetrahymena utriculariae]
MKYYKDEILNKWLAKFKDSDFQNKFHEEIYSKRFKLVYLIALYVIAKSVSIMIFVKGLDYQFLSSVIASIFFTLSDGGVICIQKCIEMIFKQVAHITFKSQELGTNYQYGMT